MLFDLMTFFICGLYLVSVWKDNLQEALNDYRVPRLEKGNFEDDLL